MSDSDPLAETDFIGTRIIGAREFECDGAAFQWWAVGESPALVSVYSSVFGSLREFTHKDAETFAMTLARKLLDAHYARAKRAREAQPEPDEPETESSDTFDKAGWFQSPS